MRRTIANIPCRASTTSSISAVFSTSSSGGVGGGRGGGSPFRFTADSPTDSDPNSFKPEGAPSLPHGHGGGRGKPPPSFSSFLRNDSKPPSLGRGQAFVTSNSTSPPQREPDRLSAEPPKRIPKMPHLFVKNDETQNDYADSGFPPVQDKPLPESIMNVLSGAGRGKPMKAPVTQSEKPKEENRHLRKQRRAQSPVSDAAAALSNEEKMKKAVGILSRGGAEAGRAAAAGRVERRGSWGRGRERGTNESEEEPSGLYLGDPADEEKVAQRLGPEIMSKIAEGFEEMKERVLPSPYEDALLEAFDTNLRIECELEYLMEEEFGMNPDIDEKPPISLPDALEKMKPFLMAYEGIQSQEEWEQIIEHTMKRVPLIKEIIDHYSGPDRVTAKEQQEELERVAKTLPASAPSSVKRFTENALYSLQSNPGWGFDKKCEFMDKLVLEVSKHYKQTGDALPSASNW